MNRGNPARDTIALAGWLFADLLLGLGLLFFVAGSKGTPPAPTPTITGTPTRTYTLTPTVTRYPTNTPYPTFTPIYTYTPYPTFTAAPPNLTYTPYPTFTPVPPEWTYTPYPTYTPFPPVATYTPAATVEFGLDQVPFVANLHVNPGTAAGLLSGSEQARAQMRAELQPQLQTCLAPFNDVARAGVALIFGTNPSPTIGNRAAEEVAAILAEQYPQIFGNTVMKTYHFISADPGQNGDIELEIYFIGVTSADEPFTPDSAGCNP